MELILGKLSELGFLKTHDVAGIKTLNGMWSGNSCGIYILHFTNGEFYVGKSINVIDRFAQHARNYHDIDKISFKQAIKSKLDEEEKRVTKLLESNGILLRNIQNVTFSYGETDFDKVMNRNLQEQWLNDLTFNDLEGVRTDNLSLRSKYRSKYVEFTRLPFADEILHVTSAYVKTCIPAVKRGEISFWSCSCLPKKSKIPYIRINVGWQTSFDAYVWEDKPCFQWYQTRSLAEEVFNLSFDSVNEELDNVVTFADDPDLEVFIAKSNLIKAGMDQVFVIVPGTKNALKVLEDSMMRAAVRIFNLGLAQKSPCPWGKNHCLDLADRLLM